MTSTPLNARERWRERIEQQAKSGQSIAAFCASQGFAASSFYVQRKQLQLESPSGLSTDKMPFIALESSPEAKATASFELVLRCGRCLRVPAGFDAESLMRLLEVLEGGA